MENRLLAGNSGVAMRRSAPCPAAARSYARRAVPNPMSVVMSAFVLLYVPSEHLGFDPHRLERLTDAMQREIDQGQGAGAPC